MTNKEKLDNKRRVLEIYGWQCASCGSPTKACHHIILRAEGGSNNKENLIPLCRDCEESVHRLIYEREGNRIQAKKKRLYA